jgi:hypothetical protein
MKMKIVKMHEMEFIYNINIFYINNIYILCKKYIYYINMMLSFSNNNYFVIINFFRLRKFSKINKLCLITIKFFQKFISLHNSFYFKIRYR